MRPCPARRTDNNRDRACRARPGADRGGSVRRFQALGDEQAEQILGEEIGRVQRIDVGAQRRAERGGEVAAVCDGVDAREDRLQRRGAARVDPGAGRARRHKNRRSALVGAGGGIGAGGAGDDLAVAPSSTSPSEERADRWCGRRAFRRGRARRRWRSGRSRRPARRRSMPATSTPTASGRGGARRGWAEAAVVARRASEASRTKRRIGYSRTVMVE